MVTTCKSLTTLLLSLPALGHAMVKSSWQGKLGNARREGFSSSPVAVDGKVFFTNDDGETFVLGAGPEFNLLHVNRLGESVLASPALIDGIWYWRTTDHLLAIGNHVSQQ